MNLAEMAERMNDADADRRRAGAPRLPKGSPAPLTEAERHRLALDILAGKATADQFRLRLMSPDEINRQAALDALDGNPNKFKFRVMVEGKSGPWAEAVRAALDGDFSKADALEAEEKERRLKAEKKAASAPRQAPAPRPELKASPAPRPAADKPKPPAPAKPPRKVLAPSPTGWYRVSPDGTWVPTERPPLIGVHI